MDIERIPLTGANNTRDLGGIINCGGKEIAPRRLIRSGALSGLTEADKRILLDQYNLKTVIDFRSDRERDENPDPALPRVSFLYYPVLDTSALGVTRTENTAGLKSTYILMNELRSRKIHSQDYMKFLYKVLVSSSHSIAQYRTFFHILLKQQSGAVLWHCTAGKDRAGMAAVLLLFALGVSHEVVLQDYLITGTFTQSDVERSIQAVEDEAVSSALRPLLMAEEEYFMTALSTISDNFGGMERYLENQMDLTPHRRQQLQDMYLC